MFPSVKTVKTVLVFLVLPLSCSTVFAQYGADRELRLAKEAKEESDRRIDQSKEMIDQSIDEIKAVAVKNIDAILLAGAECKRATTLQKRDNVGELFSDLENEISNFQASLERKKQALERISTLLESGVKRSCYSGFNEKIDSYLTCMYAREKNIHNAANLYGMAMLENIKNAYVTSPFQAYKRCSIDKNFYSVKSYKSVIESTITTSALIEEYAEKLRNSSNKVMGIRN
jgi:hypothetical protein